MGQSSPSDGSGPAVDPRELATAVDRFAAAGTLLDRPSLARVYVFVCYYGPVDRPRIRAALDLPKTTAYQYVDELVELGLVEVDGDRPAAISADPVQFREDGAVVTPTTLHAVSRQAIDDDVRAFTDRHGVGTLVAAVRQAGLYYAGQITRRMAADPLGVHSGEAMVIVDALRPVVAAGREYDPAFDVLFPDVADEIEFETDIDLSRPTTES
ncbi:MAG: helix-turn-helix domain-containing protein [Halobaculum sp.]